MKFIIALILFVSLVFAESVTLKSGKKISGVINFRSLEYVIIQEDSTSYVIPFKNIKEIEFNPNYTRMSNGNLQSKIMVYKKNGKTFTLCSAIHIGNKSYYRELESILDKNQVCLYEAFGTETNEDMSLWQIPKLKYYNDPEKYHTHNPFYMVAKKLGLSVQIEQLNSDKPFWVTSDINQEKFNAYLGKRLITDSFNNSVFKYDDESELRALELDNIINKSLEYPNNKILKKIALTALADDIIRAESAPLNIYLKVVILDRNKQVLEDIMECLDNKSLSRIGVIYGAFHMEDICKNLKKQGFEWISEEWITAWKIK